MTNAGAKVEAMVESLKAFGQEVVPMAFFPLATAINLVVAFEGRPVFLIGAICSAAWTVKLWTTR